MEVIRDAAIEVRKPTMFGELIIAVVYLPILTLQGTEGKLFKPMALTVLFALAGSLVLSLTLMPVLASLALPKIAHEKEIWLMFCWRLPTQCSPASFVFHHGIWSERCPWIGQPLSSDSPMAITAGSTVAASI